MSLRRAYSKAQANQNKNGSSIANTSLTFGTSINLSILTTIKMITRQAFNHFVNLIKQIIDIIRPNPMLMNLTLILAIIKMANMSLKQKGTSANIIFLCPQSPSSSRSRAQALTNTRKEQVRKQGLERRQGSAITLLEK